jgi:mRNA interferase RelE/StbE
VEKDLARLPKKERGLCWKAILDLELDAHPPGAERIKPSTDRYSLRKGDYRIVYSVVKEFRTVDLEFVGHRRDAFRWIGK